MKEKVTVIIPVYNGEKFIERCITSVREQTYKNLEILVLNDGSKDQSEEIIQRLQKDDERIMYYSHENRGVGKTRNRGISLAQGEYIVFLDADDVFENDYVETLLKHAGKNDMVISGYKRIDSDGQKIRFEAKPVDDEWSHFKYTATSGKMYKSDFLLKNHIEYQTFKIGEDILFNLKACSLTNKIVIVPYTGYRAFYNPMSVTKQMNANIKRNHIVPVLNEITKLNLEKRYSFSKVSFFYCKTIAQHLYNQVAILSKQQLLEEVEDNVKWLRNLNYRKSVLQLHTEKSDTKIINASVWLFTLMCKLHLEKLYFSLLKQIGFKRDK